MQNNRSARLRASVTANLYCIGQLNCVFRKQIILLMVLQTCSPLSEHKKTTAVCTSVPAVGPTVLAKMLMMKVWYRKAGGAPPSNIKSAFFLCIPFLATGGFEPSSDKNATVPYTYCMLYSIFVRKQLHIKRFINL